MILDEPTAIHMDNNMLVGT